MTPAEWLTERLGGKWSGGFGTARCPAHDDRSPSLSIRDGDEGILLKCFASCASSTIVDKLRGVGEWPVPAEFIGRTDNRARVDTSAAALDIWPEARPIAGSIAELYLRRRGITMPLPPSLRFHSALKHKGTGLFLPAMVAGISGPDRHVVSIQRTFLKADGSGKAPLSEPNQDVARVVIFGDIGSEAAAYRARDIYERDGRKAVARFPTAPKDFNDELRRVRAAA